MMNGRIARRSEVAKYFAWLAGVLAVWMFLLLLVLGSGCATRSPSVQPVYYAGAGPGVAFAVDLDSSSNDVGLWERYKGSWKKHPWWMTAGHLGAAAGIYTAGDAAGFWGGSGGSRSYSRTDDKSSRQTTEEGSNYNFRVEGDGNTFNFDSGNSYGESGG